MTVTLLGVPFDAASSFRRGAARAPAAIRTAMEAVAAWSNPVTESGLDLSADGVLRDAGDVRCGEAAATRTAVERAVGDLLLADERPLVLGGDHSITYPVLRAMHAAHGPLDVMHLDAHPDLYEAYDGDRYSHATPFTRALEDGLIARLVQVGIRAATPPQLAVARRFGVELLPMKDWGRPLGFFFERPVYLSFDLDALDPAFAPGVSHPEPGGLSVREALAVLHRVHGRVVGADLVEYNPEADPDGRTAVVCVKLVKELVALLSG